MAFINKNDPDWFSSTVSTERDVGDEKWRGILIESTRDQLKCISKTFGLPTTGTKESLLTRLLSSPEVSEEHAQGRELYGREWDEDTHEGGPRWYVHDDNHVRIGANTLEEAKLLAEDYPWCEFITKTSDTRRQFQEFTYYLKMGQFIPKYGLLRWGVSDKSWLKI